MGDWKVLLVDDEKEFVSTLAERLELRGINTTVAFSGIEALKKIDQEEPELVVLDLLMPGMVGVDVLQHIKRTNPKTQVIVLTGLGSENYDEEVCKLGATECLLKPVNIDVLIERMMEALKERDTGT